MRALTDFDVRLLRVFRTVVECGGFTAAETELNISRSTISIHISNLEKRLKVKLAQRGRQGFSLTKEGQAVYSAILQLDGAFSDFSRVVSDLTSQLSGEVNLLTADQLDQPSQQFLARVLAELKVQAPAIHPSLDIMPLQHIELALLKDQAHVALMPGYRQIDGLEYELAFSTPVLLCCSRKHALFKAAANSIGGEQLQDIEVIHPGMDINPDGRSLLRAFKPGARAYQFDTRLAMILSGAWVGFLPETLASVYVERGELRYINPEEFHYNFDQHFVYKRQPREARRVELVRRIINELKGQ